MIGSLLVLIGLQLAGEVIVRLLGLPLPGPVLGMLLLFMALAAYGGPPKALKETSNGFLAHLALLFVPAGTGIVVHSARIADEWLPLAITLVGSTAITLVVTAATMRGIMRLRGDR